jgi:hypothetical protein
MATSAHVHLDAVEGRIHAAGPTEGCEEVCGRVDDHALEKQTKDEHGQGEIESRRLRTVRRTKRDIQDYGQKCERNATKRRSPMS